MSAVACPRCHAPSIPEIEAGVAQCASCAMVFEVRDAALLPFDEANPPAGVEVHREGDTLVLTLPWSGEAPFVGHVLQFAIPLGIGAGFVYGVLSDPGILLSPSGLAQVGFMSALLVGLPLYAAICYVVNSTTVRIGRDEVSVAHGPLPTHVRGVSLPAARLQGLQTRTVMVRAGRSGRVARYTLDGRGGSLLAKWAREATLEYVRDAIRATPMARPEDRFDAAIRRAVAEAP